MKLNASSPVSYPKFRKLGDAITGVFIDYQEDVPSRFGNENLLTLQGDQGKLIIRTPTNLSRTLREHLQQLPGKRLTIKYKEDLPSRKGNPVKVFDVQAEEVEPAPVQEAA
jgi:hypothetical protein